MPVRLYKALATDLKKAWKATSNFFGTLFGRRRKRGANCGAVSIGDDEGCVGKIVKIPGLCVPEIGINEKLKELLRKLFK